MLICQFGLDLHLVSRGHYFYLVLDIVSILLYIRHGPKVSWLCRFCCIGYEADCSVRFCWPAPQGYSMAVVIQHKCAGNPPRLSLFIARASPQEVEFKVLGQLVSIVSDHRHAQINPVKITVLHFALLSLSKLADIASSHTQMYIPAGNGIILRQSDHYGCCHRYE